MRRRRCRRQVSRSACATAVRCRLASGRRPRLPGRLSDEELATKIPGLRSAVADEAAADRGVRRPARHRQRGGYADADGALHAIDDQEAARAEVAQGFRFAVLTARLKPCTTPTKDGSYCLRLRFTAEQTQ